MNKLLLSLCSLAIPVFSIAGCGESTSTDESAGQTPTAGAAGAGASGAAGHGGGAGGASGKGGSPAGMGGAGAAGVGGGGATAGKGGAGGGSGAGGASGGASGGAAGAAGASEGGTSGGAGSAGGSGAGMGGAGSGGDMGGQAGGGEAGSGGDMGGAGSGGDAGSGGQAGGAGSGGQAGGAGSGGQAGGAGSGGQGQAGSAGCTDGSKSGSETDIDCGGPACSPCLVDRACLANGDCASGVCTDQRCSVSGCVPGTELVYVFTSDNEIWSFDPPSKQFAKVAVPDCVTTSSPNSMAIDRNLVAWLNYVASDPFSGDKDGSIFTFDLKTKKGCQPTGITLPSGFLRLGMGFSTDPSGLTDTLFISGQGLATIDPATKALNIIGPFGGDPNLQAQPAELTGTGNARLFGFFVTSPWTRLAEIDKASASILSDVELKGIAQPQAYAFSHWGGDFYLYTSPDGSGTHSTVARYDPETKALDTAYIPDAGRIILGAGVSTCAQTKP